MPVGQRQRKAKGETPGNLVLVDWVMGLCWRSGRSLRGSAGSFQLSICPVLILVALVALGTSSLHLPVSPRNEQEGSAMSLALVEWQNTVLVQLSLIENVR